MHASPADLALCLAMWVVPGAALAAFWVLDVRRERRSLLDDVSGDDAP